MGIPFLPEIHEERTVEQRDHWQWQIDEERSDLSPHDVSACTTEGSNFGSRLDVSVRNRAVANRTGSSACTVLTVSGAAASASRLIWSRATALASWLKCGDDRTR
jgi:hypothetical protein